MKIIHESVRLNEDRMVKFDGKTYPKFGWCVILMGGAASGKGTAFNYKIPIEGRYYNPDNLKEIERMWDIPTYDRTYDTDGNIKSMIPTGKHSDNFATEQGTWEPFVKTHNNTKDARRRRMLELDPLEDELPGQLEFDFDSHGQVKGADSNRNMKNRSFVSELHYEMDDLSDKWKERTYTTFDGVDQERLPNMIFDITAKKFTSVDAIVSRVKKAGYKVAIVWMLTKAELAIANNAGRPRSVGEKILIDSHLRVMRTAEELFETGYITHIDEFYIVDTATDFNPSDDPVGYHNTQNVYKVPCSPGGLQTIDFVMDRLTYNRNKFERELDKLQ